MDAEALASLEGWGQERRRTAALQAEVYNAGQLAFYAHHAAKDSQPPKRLTESDFLPRRVRRQASHTPERQQKANHQKMANILNSICGF